MAVWAYRKIKDEDPKNQDSAYNLAQKRLKILTASPATAGNPARRPGGR